MTRDAADEDRAARARQREQQNALARDWAAEAGPALVGRPLVEAEAAAAAAGLHVKVAPSHGAVTQEFGIGRVTITADDEQRVTAVRAG